MSFFNQHDANVAVVSGATGGIGGAIARRFVALGYRTILLGRNQQKLDALVAELARSIPNAQAFACRMDISSPGEVASGADRIFRLTDHIDVLVHAAGDGPVAGLLEATEVDWAASVQTKLLGTVRLTRALAEQMVPRKRGTIIIINGIFALQSHPLFVINSTVNAALRGFAKALSLELGAHGITVNTVHPGATEGVLWTATLKDVAARQGVPSDALAQHFVSTVPLGRITRGDDVASVVEFLVSPGAAFVNGAVINVDGGACTAA